MTTLTSWPLGDSVSPELKTKLRKLGFHDGRKRIIKRPDVKRRPIEHTSKVLNYRGEVVEAYYRGLDEDLIEYRDALTYLLEEWRWAYALIAEAGLS